MSAPDPFLTDEDNPELTSEQIRAMRPAAEVLGQAFVDAQKRPRGRPRSDRPKRLVNLRLDQDVIAHFKAGGAGWQSRMNAALKRVMSDEQEQAPGPGAGAPKSSS